jgi:hypothetical protein
VIHLIPHVRPHSAEHPNYPSERSGRPVVVSIPEGRCGFCRDRTEPCRSCLDLTARCPGCFLLQCNGATIHCREEVPMPPPR